MIMDTNKIKLQAEKMAAKAKPGIMKIGQDVYTFEFNHRTWEYVVYKNLFEYVKFNTKSLKQAKQWLVEYLAN